MCIIVHILEGAGCDKLEVYSRISLWTVRLDDNLDVAQKLGEALCAALITVAMVSVLNASRSACFQ